MGPTHFQPAVWAGVSRPLGAVALEQRDIRVRGSEPNPASEFYFLLMLYLWERPFYLAPYQVRWRNTFLASTNPHRMEYSESLTENSCFWDAQCCLLRLIFFWKCRCLLPLLQVALLPPYHQSPSVAQVGAASVPAELSFLPTESWFVWLTDGAPALVRMHLVKGFLFKGHRWSPAPHRPLLTKFPSWSRKAVRKFLIDIVCS